MAKKRIKAEKSKPPTVANPAKVKPVSDRQPNAKSAVIPAKTRVVGRALQTVAAKLIRKHRANRVLALTAAGIRQARILANRARISASPAIKPAAVASRAVSGKPAPKLYGIAASAVRIKAIRTRIAQSPATAAQTAVTRPTQVAVSKPGSPAERMAKAAKIRAARAADPNYTILAGRKFRYGPPPVIVGAKTQPADRGASAYKVHEKLRWARTLGAVKYSRSADPKHVYKDAKAARAKLAAWLRANRDTAPRKRNTIKYDLLFPAV